MKKMVTLFALVSMSSLLAACANSSKDKNEAIEGSYVLVSANDKPVTTEIPPVINVSVSDDLTAVQINGKMCNLFNSNTHYQGDLLQGNFMMTRAFCNEPALNALDTQITKMFEKGAKVEKVDGKLVITSGKTKLVYKPQTK